MTDVPHDYLEPEYYSRILLGTTWSPGVVTLTGFDRDQNWDVQQAKGSTGASSALNGAPIGQFQASFYLADQDDEDAWHDFQALIESTTNGPKPSALSIFHPDLALNGFVDVCNAGVGGLIRDERGGKTVQVKFIEYRPLKPKPVAKASPKSNSGESVRYGVGVSEDDPNYKAKEELRQLTEEASKP